MRKTHLPREIESLGRDERSPKAARIREKRAHTKVDTLRKTYGPNFAKVFRSDAHLGTVRDQTGKSLHQLVKDSGQ